MKDPDTAFRRKMSEYGLYPGLIKWDERVHHFPGKGEAEKDPRNKSGWYVGFRDRCGGQFGDFSQGMPAKGIPWQMKRDKPPTEAEREHWKHQDAKPTKRQVAARTRAAEEVGAAWEAAVPANRTNVHPYLEAKHIDRDYARVRVLKKGTLGLKIMGRDYTVPQDILLIPMRKNKKLVNVQRIFGKAKRYWPSAEVIGTVCVVGGDHFKRNKKTLYLCEGWATAWSIAECTKTVCLVAFVAGGLLPVAKRIRKKYRKMRLIIAADNDRWTSLSDDTPNPGVWYATKAAEEVGADVAIPDFKDLSGKPTDFNDLHRVEGPRAVKKWLDPKIAYKAATLPEVEEPDWEPGADGWAETAPFRFLGMHRDRYRYLPQGHGQIVALTAASHAHEMELARLASDDWWRREFPSSSGNSIDWRKAGKATMEECHKCGVFQPERIRGRGFWRDDDGKIIAHFGDRLLLPGGKRVVRPEAYKGQAHIYTRLPRFDGAHQKEVMDIDESRTLVDMFASRAWDDEASGFLLAGWVALAPFSGALPWRPHLWLTGSSGSGKTTLIQRMIMPLLGGMGLYTEGATTEAAIRRKLDACARPVVLDDAEQSTAKPARARVRAIQELARSASSSGGRLLRGGSASSAAMNFRATSMFLLASVAAGFREEADKSRFAVLSLKSPEQLDPVERRKEWEAFQPELDMYFTPMAGRSLIARTAQWLRTGRFDKLQTVVKSAANIALGDARAADQLGTLATGTWLMLSDDIPEESQVVEWFYKLAVKTYGAGDEPKGFTVLQKILQQAEGVRKGLVHHLKTVGELVDLVAAGPTTPTTTVTYCDAVKTLKRRGIKVKGLPDEEQFLVISNQSEWVSKRLAKTTYAGTWIKDLRTIPSARRGPPTRFGKGLPRARTTEIPLRSFSDHTRAAA